MYNSVEFHLNNVVFGKNKVNITYIQDCGLTYSEVECLFWLALIYNKEYFFEYK